MLFFKIMFVHLDWSEMQSIVEYYQFDPKLIFLCSLIMQYNELAEEGCVCYTKITQKLFEGSKRVAPRQWFEKYQPILDTVSYTVDESSHVNTLMSLKSSMDEYKSFKFKPQICIFNTILLVLYTKTHTFRPLLKAFNATKLPPVKVVPPEYENLSTIVNDTTMKENFKRAQRIVCGSNLSEFEMSLSDECMSLCMSAYFQPETVMSILQSLSLSMFPMNMEKKLIIFFRYGDVGKTYLCSKITQMLSPLVVAFPNLRSVMDQVSFSDQSGIILTELKQIESRDLKTITGNDAKSTRIYYSQTFETFTIPPLMHAATNHHIQFTEQSVDEATLNRLHTIHLTGRQINPDSKVRQPSFFNMLADRDFYKNLLNVKMEDSASALSWLAYATYVKYRRNNLSAHLEVDTVDSILYRHNVHFNNCKVFRFLNLFGIQKRKEFVMCKSIFKKIVRANCNKENTLFQSETAFFIEFEKLGSNLQDTENYLADYQTTSAIDFIAKQMDVQEAEGECITLEQMVERLDLFTSPDLQLSAGNYFSLNNSHRYNEDTETDVGVSFTSDDTDLYDGHISYDEYDEFEEVQAQSNIKRGGVSYNTNIMLNSAGIVN